MAEAAKLLGNVPPESAPAEEILAWGLKQFGERFGICTSFQLGGMVIIDMAARLDLGKFQLFTIDTGRLPEATHEIIEQTRGPLRDSDRSTVSRHARDDDDGERTRAKLVFTSRSRSAGCAVKFARCGPCKEN